MPKNLFNLPKQNQEANCAILELHSVEEATTPNFRICMHIVRDVVIDSGVSSMSFINDMASGSGTERRVIKAAIKLRDVVRVSCRGLERFFSSFENNSSTASSSKMF